MGEVREGDVKGAVLAKQYLEDLVPVLIGIDRQNDLLRVEALDLGDGPSLPIEADGRIYADELPLLE